MQGGEVVGGGDQRAGRKGNSPRRERRADRRGRRGRICDGGEGGRRRPDVGCVGSVGACGRRKEEANWERGSVWEEGRREAREQGGGVFTKGR